MSADVLIAGCTVVGVVLTRDSDVSTVAIAELLP